MVVLALSSSHFFGINILLVLKEQHWGVEFMITWHVGTQLLYAQYAFSNSMEPGPALEYESHYQVLQPALTQATEMATVGQNPLLQNKIWNYFSFPLFYLLILFLIKSFFLFDTIFFLFLIMYMHACMFVSMCAVLEEAIRSPGSGVTGSLE